jgi:outer membrane receptor protein involved in Fe transport
MEAGYQGRYEIEKENYVYSDYDAFSDTWIKDLQRSYEIDFSENTQSIYTTYANKCLGFDYKVGLRAEYYKRFLDQKTIDEQYNMDSYDLFPDAYLTRQISKSHQIQLTYSRRVNRPGGRQLDPFINYSDPLKLRGGNPFLEAEYVDSYELNFQNNFKQSFISLETYYRRTNNKISDWTEELGGDTLFFTYKNLEFDNSLGLELNANLVFTKWWRFNASGTAYYYNLGGSVDSIDVSNESFNWNIRLNNSFSFKSKTRIQLTGFYNGPTATAQGTRSGFFFSNLSVRQDFLKDKLSVTLSCQDIFGTASFEDKSNTGNTAIYSKMTREGRVFNIALAYRINNFKQKRNGEGREDNIDMDMNMGQ